MRLRLVPQPGGYEDEQTDAVLVFGCAACPFHHLVSEARGDCEELYPRCFLSGESVNPHAEKAPQGCPLRVASVHVSLGAHA